MPEQLEPVTEDTLAIPILLEIMYNKDPETSQHSSRVQRTIDEFIPILVKNRIIKEEDVAALWTAAILHDIGKLFVEDEILECPRRLDDKEYLKIKSHPERGFKLLKSLDIPDNIKLAVKHHHERWDGRKDALFPAYPDGLKGRDIPLFARIISLADTYDALVSRRRYKDPITHSTALQIVENNAGTQFDPTLTMLFVETMQENENMRRAEQRQRQFISAGAVSPSF